MTDRQATLLAGCTILVVMAICVMGLAIAYRLDRTALAVEEQTRKCMLGDDR